VKIKKIRKILVSFFAQRKEILGSAVYVLNTKRFAVLYISIFDFEEFLVNAYLTDLPN
jgi:hypothetical protein